MLFKSHMTTGRDSAFVSHDNISDTLMMESFFEDGDAIVYQAMCDSMCATYHGVCADAPEIVREGLGDMAKSAYDFFMGIIKKIGNFIKNTFNYLMSYILDFDKFIEKYKDNSSKFKEFEVSGYHYTIDSSEVDKVGIEKIISDYNSNVKNIKTMEMDKLQDMIVKSKTADTMGELRGKISGLGGHVKADKFEDAMMKMFRNKSNSKSTIKVNTSNIGEIISDFRKHKEIIKDVKEEGYKIQSILADLADFFKNMPHYEYKDSDTKEIKHYDLSADTKRGDLEQKESGSDSYSTDYYKKLTAYYNFCFRMTKDIMAIYTKAYTIKVNALKEAINFHKGIIRQALSPFNVEDESDSKATKESFSTTIVDGEVVTEGEDFLLKDRENFVVKSPINELAGGNMFGAYKQVFSKITELKQKHNMRVLSEADVHGDTASTKNKVIGGAMAGASGILGGPIGMGITFALFKKAWAGQYQKDENRMNFINGKTNKYLANVYFGENVKKFIGDVNSKLGNTKVVHKNSTYVFSVKAKAITFENGTVAQVWVECKKRPVKEEFQIFPVDSSKPLVDEAVSEATNYAAMEETTWDMHAYEVYYEHFNQYMNEIDVLGEAYHRGMIMMEDVEIADKGENGEDRGIFQTIIDFIKKMINTFIDKAKNLFKNNKAWFDANDYKFDELSEDAYGKLNITIIDYAKRGAYKMPNSSMKDDNPNLGKKGYQSLEELGPKVFPELTRLSGSGNLVEGAKIYFRGGTNKLVKFTGGSVKPLCDQMRSYCNKYNDVADGIRKEIEKITKSLEAAQDSAAKEASASYSIAEGEVIEETVFNLFPWIDENGNPRIIAREAEAGKTEGESTAAPKASVSAEGEAPKGENGKEPTEEEKKKAQEEKDAAKATKNAKVMYWRVQSKVAAAMLTIAEERYAQYIKTLHDVLSAAKVTNKKEPSETRS